MVLWLAAGCRLPTFDEDVLRQGITALDYTVDRMQVIGVRTIPPLAPQGEPRTVEALVVGPGGTRHDVEITYRTCGLSTTLSVGVVDLRCFDGADLVTEIGTGETVQWAVPEISFPDCAPYDGSEVPEPGDAPGARCHSVVPVLAEVTAPDGEVAFGANHVAIPISEIPERLVFAYDTGDSSYPSVDFLGTSFADPMLPVTLTAGEPEDGWIALELTIEDPHYTRVAWWVDGGELRQSGRTLIERPADDVGHAYNQWVLPDDGRDRATVWVVLSEWRSSYGALPDAQSLLVSQPAWAELTVEVP